MTRVHFLLVATFCYVMMVQVKAQSCTITDGVDYKGPGNNANEGQLVTLFNIASANDCCSACSTFAECKYFSYSKGNSNSDTYQQCKLKTNVAVAYSNSNFQGGVSSQNVPNKLSYPCSNPVSGTDYDNGFLGLAINNVADVSSCCNACKNYTGCNYYGYASSNKACYLKGSNANPSANSGVTSGSIVQKSNVAQRTGKRGLGVFDTVSCSDIKLLPSVSWAYNWAPQVQNELRQCYIDLGIEYVPMQWGLPLALQNIDTSADWLLGFNEPNFQSQSNIAPKDAAAAWPSIQDFAKKNGMKIVSPSASAGGNSDAIEWLDQFFGNCTGCYVDAIATHIYSCYPGGVKGYTDQFKKYGKPIWLTEFACADWEYDKVGFKNWNDLAGYVNATLNLIEADSQYARYAYFGTGRGTQGVGRFSNIYDPSKSALSPVGTAYINHGISPSPSPSPSSSPSPTPSPSTPSPSTSSPSPTSSPSTKAPSTSSPSTSSPTSTPSTSSPATTSGSATTSSSPTPSSNSTTQPTIAPTLKPENITSSSSLLLPLSALSVCVISLLV